MVLRKNVRLLAGIQEIPNFFLDSMVTGYEAEFYRQFGLATKALIKIAVELEKLVELKKSDFAVKEI